MFRSRQKMPIPPAFPARFTIYEPNERGELERKVVDQSEIVLPDVSTTDLADMLAAGIDPRQVNTRILSAGTVVTDLSVEKVDENTNPEEGE